MKCGKPYCTCVGTCFAQHSPLDDNLQLPEGRPMTNNEHTEQSELAELKPCPFCGGRASSTESGHSADCYFTQLAMMRNDPPGDLSRAPAVVAAWNRRALLSSDAKPVQDGELPPLPKEEIVRVVDVLRSVDKFSARDLLRDFCESHARAALLAADKPAEWHDEKPDQWTPEIEAAHPLKTKNYEAWDTAMQMVGNRRNKHALVELVCWLLQRAADKPAESGGEAVEQAYQEGKAYAERYWSARIEPALQESASYREAYFKLLEQIANLKSLEPPSPIFLYTKPQADKVGGEAVACQTPETCFYAGCHGACTQPQPSALPDDVVKDAAMLNWMLEHVVTGSIGFGDWWISADDPASEWKSTLRAAMLKEGK